MEQVQLEAVMRKKDQLGKKFANRLRRDALIPAVVYKAGKETMAIALNARAFSKVLHTSKGGNVIIELKISDPECSDFSGVASGSRRDAKHIGNIRDDSAKHLTKTVIIKEIQYHPFKDAVLHVDFNQIALDEVIKVKVAITTKGKAVGVVRDAGILERIMWEVEVECLPTQIPEKLEIDVTDLEIGHSKAIKDLIVPGGIKLLADPEQIVVSAAAKKAVEEVVAAPEAEIAEPEVIREKKPEEEAPAEEAAAPPQEKKPSKEKEEKK